MAEAGSNFNSRSIGLRAQKKLLGKMASKRVAKIFIDETTGELLDTLYRVSKEYSGNKKEAEKLMKDIIKTVIKIGLLYRNDQFNAEELAMAERFKKKFHTTSMTLISFYEVDFSFDKNYLNKLLMECQAMLSAIIRRHLTEKSQLRIEHVFGFYGDPTFLEAMFRMDGQYRKDLGNIVNHLHKMMEAGSV